MTQQQWKTHARTDTGSIRERNEDNYLVRPEYGLFAVADGMGGRVSGDVASEIFVETLETGAESIANSAARGDAVGDPRHREKLLQKLTSIFLEANRKIYNTGQGEMGTTGDAILLSGRSAIVAHVGDSRTYLLRDGELNRLTTDHTYAEQTDDPAYADEEYEHVLTRSLGTKPHVQVDTVFVELTPGDAFLLCTDGVTKHLDPEEIESLAADRNPEELVDELVSRSRSVGGVDNTTAVACQYPEEPDRNFDSPESVDTTRKLELLQELGLFAGLEGRTILQLLRHVYTVEFESGQKLIRQDSTEGALYVIVTGTATVRRDGTELARVEPGEHIGEMALIDEGPRSADVVADEAVRALRITRAEFSEMILSDPEIGNHILQNLLRHCMERLRDTTEQLLVDDSDRTD